MGVRCAELCKCTDCRNVDDGSGSLNKKLLPRTLHAAASAAQQCNAARLQHPQQFWPIASGLGVAAAAVGATPAGSAAMGLGPGKSTLGACLFACLLRYALLKCSMLLPAALSLVSFSSAPVSPD